MKKYAFFALVAFLAIGLLAPACNAAGETKTIRLWSDQMEPIQQKVTEAMIKDFESSHQGVKVEVEYIAFKDRQAKMTAALAAQDVPEVALLSSQYATSLPSQGALRSLDDLMKSLGGPNAFAGASLALAKTNGHYYTLPYASAPVVMWYRKDRFDENGLKPPKPSMNSTRSQRPFPKRARATTSPWAPRSAGGNTPMRASVASRSGPWEDTYSMNR